MQKADYLLRLMKQQTDALVAKDEKLQQFLMWVNEKSLSVEVPYKPAAVRAFYFAVAVARDMAGTRTRALSGSRDLARALNLSLNLMINGT
jgi:predicted NACHT family NTPase